MGGPSQQPVRPRGKQPCRQSRTRCVVAFCCDGQRKNPAVLITRPRSLLSRSPGKTADVIRALWIDRHKSAPHKQTHVPAAQLLRLRLDFKETQWERASLGPPVVGEANRREESGFQTLTFYLFFFWNKDRLEHGLARRCTWSTFLI